MLLRICVANYPIPKPRSPSGRIFSKRFRPVPIHSGRGFFWRIISSGWLCHGRIFRQLIGGRDCWQCGAAPGLRNWLSCSCGLIAPRLPSWPRTPIPIDLPRPKKLSRSKSWCGNWKPGSSLQNPCTWTSRARLCASYARLNSMLNCPPITGWGCSFTWRGLAPEKRSVRSRTSSS